MIVVTDSNTSRPAVWDLWASLADPTRGTGPESDFQSQAITEWATADRAAFSEDRI